MNQFAGVLSSATEAVASALDTQATGIAGRRLQPAQHRARGRRRGGRDVPGRRAEGRARRRAGRHGGARAADRVRQGAVPREGAVGRLRGVRRPAGRGAPRHRPGGGCAKKLRARSPSPSRRSKTRATACTIDQNGDIGSIFDKTARTRSCSPRRRGSRSRPTTRATGPPGTWTSRTRCARRAPTSHGPAKIRIVENGPARVAVEVTRETEGSTFVQTIRLSAGDAGNRVEFANAHRLDDQGSAPQGGLPADGVEPERHLQLGHRHHRAADRPASGSSRWPRTSGST